MEHLCSIKSGKSDTQDAVDDGPYIFFDRSRTIKRSTRYLYDCEALIIPGEGTEFLPKHFSGKFDLHQRAYALYDFSDRINVRFLFHFLHYMSDYFPRVAVGATVKSLRLRHFEQLPVLLPNLPEQRRIAGVLDEVLGAIAIAKAKAETNLRNVHDLFSSELQTVFGKPASAWQQRTLQEVATYFGRGRSRHRPRNAPHLYGGRYPFVQTGDIRNAVRVVTEFSQTYSEDGLVQSKLWPKGTVCITIAANIAETAILGFDACFPDSVIGVVVSPKEADAGFVQYVLESYRERLQALGKGSAQDNINMGTFENQRFPFPPVGQQREVAARLDRLRGEAGQLASIYQQKLAALEELRKSLLNQAFSGQL